MAKVTRKQLAATIAGQIGKLPERKLAKSIAAYLIAERQTKDIESLLRDVKKLRAERQGLVEADVTSAFPLSSSIKREIKKILEADKLLLNEIIDKNVLGGVRVESNDLLLDLTVRSRLNQLKSATKE